MEYFRVFICYEIFYSSFDFFPCSHFLGGGDKQEKQELEEKQNKQRKKKEKKKAFFLSLAKELPLHSFEFSSSRHPECSFDAGFC